MFKRKLKPKPITRQAFKPFGWLIDYARTALPKSKNLFRIVIRERKKGWRIAYLVVRDRSINRLEQHPDSLESFEPIAGKGLLYVATKKNRGPIKCFLLDKPVILKKGIWHGVVTRSREFDIKIVENATVKCAYQPLGFELC